MANTTNYNWETPDDTDLVKDGAAAIRTLGNSIDTTTKNLNPETTTGDIAYRSATSNTNTRLAIGSTGQVLTVAAGVPSWATPSDQTPLTTKGDLFTFSTLDARLGVGANGTVLTADSAETTGLKWVAASSGALSIITPTSIANSGGTASASGGQVTFSGVNSVSLNGVFSATYDNYLVWIEADFAGGSRTGRLRLRASGSDNTTSNYRSGYMYSGFSGSSTSNDNRNGVDYWVGYYSTSTESTSQTLFISSPNLSKFTRFGSTFGINDANAHFSGVFVATTAFDGITFFPETVDTFTGKIRVYGYANS